MTHPGLDASEDGVRDADRSTTKYLSQGIAAGERA